MHAYDLALTFEKDYRWLAEQIAAATREEGFEVFYDYYERAELWGRDLTEVLPRKYTQSKYVLMFLSPLYLERMWTVLERQAIIAEFLRRKGDGYVLPLRLDGFSGEVPGVSALTGYIDLNSTSSSEVTCLIEILLHKLRGA